MSHTTPPTAPANHLTAPPAIQAAISANSRLLTSTIFRLATGHCFDATYSTRFQPHADDHLICPCEFIPHPNPNIRPRQIRHTKEHVLFRCLATRHHRQSHLATPHSLTSIFDSVEATSQLCAFLRASNSSLLRPLPKPVPRPDPP